MQGVEQNNLISYTKNVRHSDDESKLKKTISSANLSNLFKPEVEKSEVEEK